MSSINSLKHKSMQTTTQKHITSNNVSSSECNNSTNQDQSLSLTLKPQNNSNCIKPNNPQVKLSSLSDTFELFGSKWTGLELVLGISHICIAILIVLFLIISNSNTIHTTKCLYPEPSSLSLASIVPQTAQLKTSSINSQPNQILSDYNDTFTNYKQNNHQSVTFANNFKNSDKKLDMSESSPVLSLEKSASSSSSSDDDELTGDDEDDDDDTTASRINIPSTTRRPRIGFMSVIKNSNFDLLNSKEFQNNSHQNKQKQSMNFSFPFPNQRLTSYTKAPKLFNLKEQQDGDSIVDVSHEEQDKQVARSHDEVLLNSNEVCMTPGCIKAAAQVLSYIDNNTDPCDDFYQFACGNWIKENNIIPDERAISSITTKTREKLDAKLRLLLEQDNFDTSTTPVLSNNNHRGFLQQRSLPSTIQGQRKRRLSELEKPKSKQTGIVERHMKNLYKSCMNLSLIEQRGDEPVLSALKLFGNKWPVLDDDVTSVSKPFDFDWIDWLVLMRRNGFSNDILIDVSVVPDFKNSTNYIIDLDQGILGLPERSYYLRSTNDSTFNAYYDLMVESCVLLGTKRQIARLEMRKVLSFETLMARMSRSQENRRNITVLYNKMTLRQLYQLVPNVNWIKLLVGILSPVSTQLPPFNEQYSSSHVINLHMDTDFVNIKEIEFVKSFVKLIEQTDKRTLANFMLWRVVRQSAAQLGKKWRDLYQQYQQTMTGRKSEPARWDTCMGVVSNNLEAGLAALYVRNYFGLEAKSKAGEMFNYIKAQFMQMLTNLEWMDDETREEAIKKALAIHANVGYPDELLDNELIESLYPNLSISSEYFYENIRNLRIISTNVAFSRLNTRNERNDWRKHTKAAVVNAYYNIFDNAIEIPAGILQDNFFTLDRPMYMNFGGIGYVIGHEITHGFDDRGRQFDLRGNSRNWWRSKTDEQFRKLTKCMVDQYNNYTLPENNLPLNGLRSLGENIADNGGVKQAFNAYRRWVADKGVEPKLPGLNYSQEQMFWISVGQVWCAKQRPESLKLRVVSGSHSPNKFRIIGPLSNLPQFSRSFNCAPNSPMNPQNKCAVW